MAGGFYISFELEGEVQLSRRLRMASNGVKDMSPAFKKIGRQMRQTFEGPVFESEGREIGVHWKPLSPAYARWKSQKYPGRGILQRTGKMQGNFKNEHGKNYARIYNPTKYFKYHQSNQNRSSSLPRRQMMKLGQLQREQVQKVIQAHLRAKIK